MTKKNTWWKCFTIFPDNCIIFGQTGGQYWYEAMDRPGSLDMRHVHDLIRSRPFLSLVPDQEIISSTNPEDGSHCRAAKGDGYLLIYNPYGITLDVNMSILPAKRLKCYWYSPSDGSAIYIGIFRSGPFIKSFDPPGV
jgi:hypothetical protein